MSNSYDHNGVRVVDCDFFVQVVGTQTHRYLGGRIPDVKDLRVVAHTKNRPTKPQSGAIVLKLTLRFPVNCFLPLTPSAIIDIPDTMSAASTIIEVVAEDPNDPNAAAVAASWAAAARGD